MQEQEALYAELDPLLKKAGIELIEFSLSRKRGSVQVRAVIFAAGGTGIAECSTAHRIIYPRLLEGLGVEDPYLEVMSPGIDRVIRSRREYEVFAGSKVRVLENEGADWIRGRIEGLEGENLVLETKEGRLVLPLSAIAKARLDSTEEGE